MAKAWLCAVFVSCLRVSSAVSMKQTQSLVDDALGQLPSTSDQAEQISKGLVPSPHFLSPQQVDSKDVGPDEDIEPPAFIFPADSSAAEAHDATNQVQLVQEPTMTLKARDKPKVAPVRLFGASGGSHIAQQQRSKAVKSEASSTKHDVLLSGAVHSSDSSQGAHSAHKRGNDIRSLRPGAGGLADVVSFAVFAKQIFGADLKHNKFSMDAIVALKWKDMRAAKLVPSGMDEISLSRKDALKKIWMPEVVITNRDIRAQEVIATTVTIFKSGEVTKIERSGVRCNNVYELSEYPFDKQKLQVKIASSKYMLRDVLLVPDKDESNSGARKAATKGTPYTLEGHRIFAFNETDGALKKSRGVLEITVGRNFGTYQENHLMPAAMLLMISWGVFWFPFEQPFITPRLALSILALLSFTTLLLKSDAALPDSKPYNWNDLFNQQVQAMMFFTIILNIYSECCKHKFKCHDLAIAVNNEGKVVLPLLAIVILTITLTGGATGWISLTNAGHLNKGLVLVTLVIYMAYNATLLDHHVAKAKRKDIEDEQIRKMAEEEEKIKKSAQPVDMGTAPAAV